jgi:hypothetical protein
MNPMQSSKIRTTENAKSKTAIPELRTTKAEANRKNALKSTGPNTPRGKHYSSRNARKHGLYSKELLISEADMPEFEEMRSVLEAQLQPSTESRILDFDYVVACHWRRKLGLRLERAQFGRQFADEKPKNEPGEAVNVDRVIERWYGSSRADTYAAIRLLEQAIEEFQGAGHFREDTKTSLGRAFALDFVSWLEKWDTMPINTILMADQIASHIKAFKQIPEADVKSPSTPGEPTKVVIDPLQGRHMVVKLLEQQMHFLKELLVVSGQNTLGGMVDAAQSSDFNPRFLADASRELRRAMDSYMALKNL